jgi:hypothetical protein
LREWRIEARCNMPLLAGNGMSKSLMPARGSSTGQRIAEAYLRYRCGECAKRLEGEAPAEPNWMAWHRPFGGGGAAVPRGKAPASPSKDGESFQGWRPPHWRANLPVSRRVPLSPSTELGGRAHRFKVYTTFLYIAFRGNWRSAVGHIRTLPRL